MMVFDIQGWVANLGFMVIHFVMWLFMMVLFVVGLLIMMFLPMLKVLRLTMVMLIMLFSLVRVRVRVIEGVVDSMLMEMLWFNIVLVIM